MPTVVLLLFLLLALEFKEVWIFQWVKTKVERETSREKQKKKEKALRACSLISIISII